MMLTGKTYWVIGASEGLGLALAASLQAEGARLILSARSADKLQAATQRLPGSRAVVMDVTDAASVQAGVLAAGQVDGMVY